VGFISEQGPVTARRAFWTSTLFAVGILITIAAIGAVTAAAGRIVGEVGRYGNYIVAIIFFAVGLHLLGVIPCRGPVRAKSHEAEGFGRPPSSSVWFSHRARPLHVRLHAPMLGVCLSWGQPLPFRRTTLAGLRSRPLRGDCCGGHVHGTRARLLGWNERSRGVAVCQISRILVILGGVANL